jgi:hypothetical protein
VRDATGAEPIGIGRTKCVGVPVYLDDVVSEPKGKDGAPLDRRCEGMINDESGM